MNSIRGVELAARQYEPGCEAGLNSETAKDSDQVMGNHKRVSDSKGRVIIRKERWVLIT